MILAEKENMPKKQHTVIILAIIMLFLLLLWLDGTIGENNQSEAAKILGINRTTLRNKLKEYKII